MQKNIKFEFKKIYFEFNDSLEIIFRKDNNLTKKVSRVFFTQYSQANKR